jgi:hypothetical protein
MSSDWNAFHIDAEISGYPYGEAMNVHPYLSLHIKLSEDRL